MFLATLTLFFLAASGPALLLLMGCILRRERSRRSLLARAVLALGAVSMTAAMAWACVTAQALWAFAAAQV